MPPIYGSTFLKFELFKLIYYIQTCFWAVFDHLDLDMYFPTFNRYLIQLFV